MVRFADAVAVIALPLVAGLRNRHRRVSGNTSLHCEMETDCMVNTWCQDPTLQEWCRSNGELGHCPAPQCRRAPPPGLEACLKGPGGSPWTYVGEDQYQGQDNLKGIHNARVARSIKPSAIVFVKEASQVTHAVSCAYQFQLPVYGRSGMNQYEASCTSETGAGCVIVDTNNLDQFVWARDGCQNGAVGCFVEMGPGVSLGAAYIKLSKRNYTIPGGSCAQVRVAGLTLGGGKGWLSRKNGMLSDRLVSITAVLLNGTQVHANAAVHAHLFWLARGGGGSIFPGVVTALSFAVVPMPQSPATYAMRWDWNSLSTECRVKVMANWYDQLATDSDNDVWAGLTIQSSGSGLTIQSSDHPKEWRDSMENGAKEIVISVIYVGSDKDGMEQKLRNVSPVGCSAGNFGPSNPNNNWMDIVKSGNCNDINTNCDLEALNNNCGWLLQDGQKPTHTDCIGYSTRYDSNHNLAYRSLVFGKGSVVPQGVWNTLAQLDLSRFAVWINFTPTNGVTGDMPPNATAYSHRDAGYVTMQQVMFAATVADVEAQMLESATMMTRLTTFVPAASYYNYLDRAMNQYGATPRAAYYGTNADRVDTYLKEYTVGVNPNGCERCDSWELRLQR